LENKLYGKISFKISFEDLEKLCEMLSLNISSPFQRDCMKSILKDLYGYKNICSEVLFTFLSKVEPYCRYYITDTWPVCLLLYEDLPLCISNKDVSPIVRWRFKIGK
jgi:hypothetical protein